MPLLSDVLDDHHLMSAHKCACGWEGDNAVVHVIDAIVGHGYDIVRRVGEVTTP